jgi:small subunit ribosomal protein S9
MVEEGKLYATGKRKTAVARVWMRQGSGKVAVNKRPLEQYLVREADRTLALEPLRLSELLDKFDIYVNVSGGGISGQAGAIRHGIARALVSGDPELRDTLKRHGFLTRDSRMKERKKYGQPGARARFQYSKR